MDEIIQLFKDSISDNVLIKSEKKGIQKLINQKGFSKREFDLIRSEVYKIAREHENRIPTQNLIDWLETATKLTLQEPSNEHELNRVFFSPGHECRSAIIQQIKNAQKTVEICVFTISDNEISDQIIKAHKKGISVKIITDDDKTMDLGSDIKAFLKAGIPIKIDGARSLMHNKFCIVDQETILTGSYNWTNSAADRNFENIGTRPNLCV